MGSTLHITSGDCAGESLAKSGISGEILVWHDILYDGTRIPGWPDTTTLEARAQFLVETTAGGLEKEHVLRTLKNQYQKLASAAGHEAIVLWFDACLFDQSMLAHILTCLQLQNIQQAELLCVDAFPGIVPFNGLGQLQPSQLASLYGQRRPVTEPQFHFAGVVDKALATQDQEQLESLSCRTDAPLPWIPAAIKRWLQEQPDPQTGLGRLESLALEAIRGGCQTPADIFSRVASADRPPQYWGDITLWAKINALADRTPPLVLISGPMERLPQWQGPVKLERFRIRCSSSGDVLNN